jgi:hypothetical protein
MSSRFAYRRISQGKGADPICTSTSSPGLTIARNIRDGVVPTCVGPLEGHRSCPRRRLPAHAKGTCLSVGDRLPHQLGPLDDQLRQPVFL